MPSHRSLATSRRLALLLPLLALPLLMCGPASTVIRPTLSPVARQSGAGGTGGGPGNGPGSVRWSACSTGDCLIYEHVQSVPLPAASSATASASCNPDERMLSGGYVIEHPLSDMHVMASYPSGPNTWAVSADNFTTTAATLDADINCVHIDAASAQTSLPTPAQATVPMGTSAPVSVACPTGMVPTGGGFQVGLPASAYAAPARASAGSLLTAPALAPALPASGALNAFVVTSQPQTGGWQVAVYTQNAAASETASVVCWNAHNWSTIVDSESAPASGMFDANASGYSCPGNATTVGGGFTTSDATSGELRFQSNGDNITATVLYTWNAVALNTDAAATHNVTAIAVCAD